MCHSNLPFLLHSDNTPRDVFVKFEKQIFNSFCDLRAIAMHGGYKGLKKF